MRESRSKDEVDVKSRRRRIGGLMGLGLGLGLGLGEVEAEEEWSKRGFVGARLWNKSPVEQCIVDI